MKNSLKIICCFIGTVIGAGFASGQEIYSFFVSYGKQSIAGVFLSGILFGVFSAISLSTIYTYKINSYNEYLIHIFGKNSFGRFVSNFFEITVDLFLFSSFCVMVSGSGALFCERFGIPKICGSVALCVICLVTFLYDVKGIVNANTLLTPIMITGMLTVGICAICGYQKTWAVRETLSLITNNYKVSAIVYVSYNTISLTVVFIELKKYITSKKSALISGFCGGTILCFVACVLWCALFLFKNKIIGMEMPMTQVASYVNVHLATIYSAILFMAILTTAVSSGFALVSSASSHLKINPKILSTVLCISCIPLSQIGFSKLINTLYVFFGYVGFLVFFAIMADGIFLQKTKR